MRLATKGRKGKSRLPRWAAPPATTELSRTPSTRNSQNSVMAKFVEQPLHTPGRTRTEDDHRAPSNHALLKAAMSTPTTSLKVMLIEDGAAFRQALAFVLDKEQELEVVAQAGSVAAAREALDGGLQGRLDVALLDLALPDGDGTELVGELRRSNPSIKVMVLSATIEAGRVEELMLRAGVDAVLDKWLSPRQIAREVRREGGAG